jgi:dipeptidyl aminopeptidase/acylaminoacyl peptidase
VLHTHRAGTPTLNICGALDPFTPPDQAIQFHHALLEHRVVSELLIYPQEGHGIRKFPAVFDYAARIVDWFQTHMPAAAKQ